MTVLFRFAIMKAKEAVRLASLRAIKAAIMLAKTAEGATGEVSDQEVVKIIQKLVKKLKQGLNKESYIEKILLVNLPFWISEDLLINTRRRILVEKLLFQTIWKESSSV